MPSFRTLDDVDVKGKRVLLRVDLNVPMENGRVTDATRLERIATTIGEISGKGGKVIVWADDTTRAYGAISARGGAQSGDGGLIETSGKRALDVAGARVVASAPNGVNGQWLLDPSDVTIVHGSASVPLLLPKSK